MEKGKLTVEFLNGSIDGALFWAIDKGIAAPFDQDRADVSDAALLKQLPQRRLVRFRRQIADVQFAHLLRPSTHFALQFFTRVANTQFRQDQSPRPKFEPPQKKTPPIDKRATRNHQARPTKLQLTTQTK